MKLTSLRIQELLEYSPHRNIEGLRTALNRHAGVKLTREEARNLVVNGCEGEIAEIAAYELGINAKYKPSYKVKIKEVQTQEGRLPVGVSRLPSGNYQVTISNNKKREYLGSFTTPEEALEVRNKRALELGLAQQSMRLRTKYIGVYRKKNKFYAEITIKGKKQLLGSHPTAIEAALAYNLKAAPIGRRINEVHI